MRFYAHLTGRPEAIVRPVTRAKLARRGLLLSFISAYAYVLNRAARRNYFVSFEYIVEEAGHVGVRYAPRFRASCARFLRR